MDKLDEIFTKQKEFDTYVAEKRNLHFTQEEWMQKKALAMIEELTEVLNEVNYKWWKNPKPIQKNALMEELSDVLHFFIGMCIHAGMTSNDLYTYYMNKNKENQDRQNGLSAKEGYKIE